MSFVSALPPLNPVLARELKQRMRGRHVWLVVTLYLAVLAVILRWVYIAVVREDAFGGGSSLLASATAGRPPRLGTSVTFSPASRSRTMASTASASLSAARRWPAGDGSTTRLAINERCDVAGNGHHQERLRPSGSTVRPGTTRPAATIARATSSTTSSSGSRTLVVGWRTTAHIMTAARPPIGDCRDGSKRRLTG